MRLTDLRQILRYVPRFRDKVFVIAIDGAIVEDDNFNNLMLDIALLRSLSIGVAIVHGASYQIARLAEQKGVIPSNVDGTGVTDSDTLSLARTAALSLTHRLLEGLAANDLRGAYSNAVVAHPAGILQGVDHQHTGRVDRIDISLLQTLLKRDVVPVVAPLGCDGLGQTYRLNSDAVAVEVAGALRAAKLIYLTDYTGIQLLPDASGYADTVSREDPRNGLLRQLSVEEAEAVLKKHRLQVPSHMLSKLEHAIRAARGGVSRIHVIDGRVEEGLLAEVFSNEGIGTLIHANEYQSIRRAMKKDIRPIFALIQAGMENDELLRRSRIDIERRIEDFFLYEFDRNPVACAALHVYPEEKKAELACVCVDPKFENQGIGGKLMHYAEVQARAMGVEEIFCLSTQAFNFFMQKGGFRSGAVEDLPISRRERYERSGRRSQILAKKLHATH